MSDSWQGPGWRRADDGKWYPSGEAFDADAPPPPDPTTWAPPVAPPISPTSAALPPPPPSFAPSDGAPLPPPPPRPPAPPGAGGWSPMPVPTTVRPVNGALAGWLQALFLVVAAGCLLTALAASNAGNAWDQAVSPSGRVSDAASWRDADLLFGLVNLGLTALEIALLVVMIVWSWKSYRAAQALQTTVRKWRIGWTIGAWFIPCASIILPKLVLDETERIASGPRIGGVAVGKGTTSVVGWAWWVLFVIANTLTLRLSFDTTEKDPNGFQSGVVETAYGMVAIGLFVGALSAIAGAIYVRRVSQLLSATSFQATSVGMAPAAYGGPLTPTVMGPSVASVPRSSVDRWAAATAAADGFCVICREPLAASTVRCPRCGKRRKPTAQAGPSGPASKPAPPTGPAWPSGG
jgi:hypothetical protein